MSILPILLPLLLSADGHDSKPEREVLSVLLVDGQNNHAWPRTSPVLRAILEETGRFTVDVATSHPTVPTSPGSSRTSRPMTWWSPTTTAQPGPRRPVTPSRPT